MVVSIFSKLHADNNKRSKQRCRGCEKPTLRSSADRNPRLEDKQLLLPVLKLAWRQVIELLSPCSFYGGLLRGLLGPTPGETAEPVRDSPAEPLLVSKLG